MALKAGFSETTITPPLGTVKIGWLKLLVGDRVLDDLFARAAILDNGRERLAFVQLDTLCVRWTTTMEIRRRVEERYGFPGTNIMVAATHNHAGPAVANLVECRRDDAFTETLTRKVVDAFGAALAGLREAELGFGWKLEWGLSHNRRVVMRDGTVCTHGSIEDPQAMFIEGPIDPEVAVLAVRDRAGTPMGALVNFACHPTHHGESTELSAGYPGVLAAEMKSRGWPATLFLNGATGNLATSESMEEMGRKLAVDVESVIGKMAFRQDALLGSRSKTVSLPYRKVTRAETEGTVRGAQRFIDSELYDAAMPDLIRRIRDRKTQPAEVQVLSVDDVDFASIPAEFFVQNGLRIKEKAHPRHALIVSHANGMVGYVPHRDAFLRGGYETTFGPGYRLAPRAGDMLVDAAAELIAPLKGA